MYDLKVYAFRHEGVIEVSITGSLADTCHQAIVQDKYPGGHRVYLRDPGEAQVFIEETTKPEVGACLFMLVPWAATCHIVDAEHTTVGIYMNGKRSFIATIGDAPASFQVISLTADPRRGCSVIPADAHYPMIYSKVYGPASKQECIEWMKAVCTPNI